MVMDFFRGLEYRIVLKNKTDYFDVIPDVMKLIRKKVAYIDGINSIVLIKALESRNILEQSQYYNDKIKNNEWYNKGDSRGVPVNIDLPLTDLESEQLKKVLSIVDYESHGWYDIERLL